MEMLLVLFPQRLILPNVFIIDFVLDELQQSVNIATAKGCNILQ